MKGVKRTLVRLWGRIVCRLHEMASWVVAGFSGCTSLPYGKAKQGVRSESLPGSLLLVSLERFSFEGLGLQFYFSFQTPIRASEFMSGATI